MCKKKAFIFDTNFIIENRNLNEVVKNLSGKFTVYVTQVSIDERISQKYLELKKKYDEIKKLSEELKGIANIRITLPLDKRIESEKEFTQKGYVDLFGEHIIPFFSDKATFARILDRVYKKLPPFMAIDGASDKGFKDSLIWISLLDFFQNNGEEDVFFVTSDNGFRKNADTLYEEFYMHTGKTITIKDNGYYKTLNDINKTEPSQYKKDVPIPDVNQLREKIHDVILSLCVKDGEDYWGSPTLDRTFTINQKVDALYVEVIFSNLKQNIMDNIFETEILAEEIFELDERVTSGVPITMIFLENAQLLYEEIKQKLPDYLPQFYSAAATIINENYVESQIEDEIEIPF